MEAGCGRRGCFRGAVEGEFAGRDVIGVDEDDVGLIRRERGGGEREKAAEGG